MLPTEPAVVAFEGLVDEGLFIRDGLFRQGAGAAAAPFLCCLTILRNVDPLEICTTSLFLFFFSVFFSFLSSLSVVSSTSGVSLGRFAMLAL